MLYSRQFGFAVYLSILVSNEAQTNSGCVMGAATPVNMYTMIFISSIVNILKGNYYFANHKITISFA